MTPVGAGVSPIELPTAEDTERFGERLGAGLSAGDLVLLSGPLGAGKTVVARGIGRALGVAGPVTSPTFVIAREHPPAPGGRGVALVHVDAYRLGGVAELDDLDLDTDLAEAVVVVEWGEGLAEGLSERHLLVRLQRRADDSRVASVREVGGTEVGGTEIGGTDGDRGLVTQAQRGSTSARASSTGNGSRTVTRSDSERSR